MFQTNRAKCLAVADGLTLLFFVESLYGLFIDYSLIVLMLRIFAFLSINGAYNVARRSDGPDDVKRKAEGKPSKLDRRMARRFKRAMVWVGMILPYHIYYVYCSLGAFSGVRATDSVTAPLASSTGIVSSFVYGTHQMLFLAEQASTTVFISFVAAMQPASLWGGGGGLIGPGATLFFLDCFLMLIVLAIFSAFYAARQNGSFSYKGFELFSIDTASHIASLSEGHGSDCEEEEGANEPTTT